MALEIIRSGEAACLVRFGDTLAPEISDCVRAALEHLRATHHPALRELHPAYATLLVEYDPRVLRFAAFRSWLETQLSSMSVCSGSGRLVVIPVLYVDSYGLDLAALAETLGRSVADIIDLHSATEYHVHFLGFRPGFAYLGTLPEVLRVPRLAVPRRKVPAGSVAIAERQTGIYPLESPGGWHVLGRTPLALFRPAVSPPVRLETGDRVKFRPIEAAEFAEMAAREAR
jgi:KipI family sensor histidine kinase inhibitor